MGTNIGVPFKEYFGDLVYSIEEKNIFTRISLQLTQSGKKFPCQETLQCVPVCVLGEGVILPSTYCRQPYCLRHTAIRSFCSSNKLPSRQITFGLLTFVTFCSRWGETKILFKKIFGTFLKIKIFLIKLLLGHMTFLPNRGRQPC